MLYSFNVNGKWKLTYSDFTVIYKCFFPDFLGTE